MADNEERALEEQLELQLKDQKDSLSAIDDALAADSSNDELLAVHAELVQSIQDAEEGLLHLKRTRLMRECDSVLQGSRSPVDVVELETVDAADVEAESLADESFAVGSKCRFRYTDGRWYNGFIIESGGVSAKVSFLTPTTDSMLICKFFLQQRCRFGSNCRLSHGADVPAPFLKRYIPTIWDQSLVGSSIWAVSNTGIWREAELESWDEKLQLGRVVFRGDGSSAELGADSISLSKYAKNSDEDESDTSSDEYDSGSEEEDLPEGLGFLEGTTMQRGIQTDTAIFARWENHTRGVASKMMANMGYREGMGLGASGQGRVDPISVKVLPPKQSLGHAVETQQLNDNKGNQGKKRSRGGKRKREKKFAEAARAAKKEEDTKPDVFSLINTKLATYGESQNSSIEKKQNGGRKEGDRRALVAYDDEIKDLKVRAEKLEEMVNRNKKEKVVYEAAMKKLNETRRALADAEAAHASASNDVVNKEKEKRWLKF